MISKIKKWWALLWRKEVKIPQIVVPYRIPTLAEVERVKAAEQARKELEFMSDVQQGVAVICKKSSTKERRVLLWHTTCIIVKGGFCSASTPMIGTWQK